MGPVGGRSAEEATPSVGEERTGFDAEIIGHGPPVVFVHGAGGSPRANFPFLDELAGTFTVIAPFLPGSGPHALPAGPLCAKKIAHDLGAYLAEQGFDEYAVVGYSMGSTIAVELAAAFPSCVTAVALTAGFVRARPSMRSFVEMWAHLQSEGGTVLGRAILAAVLMPATLDDRGEAWIEQGSDDVAQAFPAGTLAHLDLLRRVDVRSALRSTTQPLLVLTPRHDRLVDPAHSADIVAIRTDALQVMLEAGHAVGDEDPSAWAAALLQFLPRR